jgi:hypothetical protein
MGPGGHIESRKMMKNSQFFLARVSAPEKIFGVMLFS